MIKTIKYLIMTIILWMLIHTIIITIDGLTDNITNTDLGVVLGNKVEINGVPSERLKSRLDKAVELYNGGYIKYILVSGGVGSEGFDEAVVMKDYLVKNGVESNLILTDSEGINTYMTAVNTSVIMEENDFSSVTIITQYYHITRTNLAFKKVGFNDVYSAHADIIEIRDLYSLFREFVAYYKYLLYY